MLDLFFHKEQKILKKIETRFINNSAGIELECRSKTVREQLAFLDEIF